MLNQSTPVLTLDAWPRGARASNRALTIICSAVALLLGASSGMARAQIVTNSPNLLPQTGEYTSATTFQTYVIGANTFEVRDLHLFGFLSNLPPPLNVGSFTTPSSSASATGSLVINFGPPSPVSASASTQAQVTKNAGPNGSPTGLFQTEMLQLSLSGGSLPAGVMVRESPTLASFGTTTITDIGGGMFQISSFFDVFTELTLDGGASWNPSTSFGRITLTPVPEPSSLALAGLGLLALHRYRRKKSR